MKKIIFLIPFLLFAKVKILDNKFLEFNFKNAPFAEISDLAYDKKDKILYMISDKGILYKFKAIFDNKIHLTPISAHYLKNKKGKRLKRWRRDSEGLAIKDNFLYISFEGKPKIAKFSKNGVKIKNLKLPKIIKNAKLRSKNKGLESLTYLKNFGFLTAFEYAPKGKNRCDQSIYSLRGKEFKVKLEPFKNCAISEIEALDDGNLLILERAYGGMFKRFVVTLKKLYINGCKNKSYCKSEIVYQIDSYKDDFIENYEGLANLRNDRFLLISDDNNNFFQSTHLIYFEIIK